LLDAQVHHSCVQVDSAVEFVFFDVKCHEAPPCFVGNLHYNPEVKSWRGLYKNQSVLAVSPGLSKNRAACGRTYLQMTLFGLSRPLHLDSDGQLEVRW
jgi:hypothetical protein